MTISDILEHWATIYKPLSHNPESDKLEDQRFFRIRYIDLENIFQRNIGQMHDLCMLYSITSTGSLKGEKKAEVSHQIWFLGKCKDTAKTLGRFSGIQQQQTNDYVISVCEDFISWLLAVRKDGIDPITKQSFASDPQLLQELKAIDIDSIGYGTLPELYANQWIIGAVDWHALKPLYNFACGSNGKYILPAEEEP